MVAVGWVGWFLGLLRIEDLSGVVVDDDVERSGFENRVYTWVLPRVRFGVHR
jgi:hypothetical protein